MKNLERKIRNTASVLLVATGATLVGCDAFKGGPAPTVTPNYPAIQADAAQRAAAAAEAQAQAAQAQATEIALQGTVIAQKAEVRPVVVAPATVVAVPEAKATVRPAVAVQPTAGSNTEGIPLHAKAIRFGSAGIPDWGYGPFGLKGLVYPKIGPEGNVPVGRSQLVTDFNGNNWVDNGTWCYWMPSGATEADLTIQGDAPAQVNWDGASNRLCLTSNADVSAAAPNAVDNAPHPTKGSSGISAAVLTR